MRALELQRQERPAGPATHPTRTVAILATGTLAYSLQQTMILPALPAFQERYGVSPSASTWLLTSFLLSSAISTPIIGRLGDMYGKARMLLVALTVFGAGIVLSAAAGSFAVVLAGRTVQGTGAAILPLAIGIVRDELPADRMGVGIGTLSSMLGVGGALALVLAGPLAEHAGLSWLFWSAVIITAPAAVLTWAFVPESPVRSPARIDVGGAVLLSIALLAFLLGISEGNRWGWGSARELLLFVAAVVFFCAWVARERRAPTPLVDLRLMRERGVWTTNVVAAGIGAAMFGSFVLIPQLAQAPETTGYGFGDSVAAAGLVLLPGALVMLVAGPAAGRVERRIGAKVPLCVGCASLTVTYIWFAVLHAREWELYVGSVFLGVGLGLGLSAMATLVVRAVPQDQTGIATAINMILRSIGGAIGAQLAASILTGSAAAGHLPSERGYSAAFLMCAGAAIVAWLAAAVVPRPSRAAPGPVAALQNTR
jgi:EmrB/QacA subfamily drug resistance transporter